MLTILGAMLGSEMIVISAGGPFGRFGASATTGSGSRRSCQTGTWQVTLM